MIVNTILDAIGRTPSVKLHHIAKHLPCTLYGKCEFLNPGGSAKDRIAYQMIVDAENSGRIKRGDTLIEPTSGNTGIGLAMAGAVLGYQVIITMPEKMSQEKQTVLASLGAKIYRTPTAAAWDAPDSHIMLAKKLNAEIPNSHILDQYSNPSNSKVHYEQTAKEIVDDFGDRLKMIVMGVGTGGTATGVAKRLKEMNPNIQIIGADPNGSILGGGQCVEPYLVEGIGYDFFPDVFDDTLIDEYIKVSDQDAFTTARRLIKEEGLLIGGSSGAAVWVALQAATRLSEHDQCLVILPDCLRNYLSKFVNDDWMRAHHFTLEGAADA